MTGASIRPVPFVQNEGLTTTISFNENIITEKDGSKTYEYETVIVSNPLTYGRIVSAIVRDKYSEDDVEAIILNGTDTAEHKAEYEALQEWRKTAKEIAHKVLEVEHNEPNAE